MNDAYDTATTFVGDLDAQRAAYAVAVGVVSATLFIYILQRSGFRAMVAVGKG